ncbi:hypothetical protein ACSP97_25065 [Streptomyces sp. SCPE 10]|uniref:hypothetical protein n=1 Tax=Streptomyces sp. SCPE 10 TaxID=3449273 RepID=UPI003F7FCA65
MGTMAAVLLSWAVALWLEGAAGLHTDAVVLAVVLTLTLARSPRTAGRRDRLLALALLPAAAAGCAGLGRLLAAHYGPGAALFTAVLALAVWIRRYGRAATTAGTLITLPLVALLVVPGPTLPTAARHEQIGWAWSALIGVLAWTSVQLVRPLADRFAPRPAGPGVPAPRRPTRSRPRPSTRMAVQPAVAAAWWLLPVRGPGAPGPNSGRACPPSPGHGVAGTLGVPGSRGPSGRRRFTRS